MQPHLHAPKTLAFPKPFRWVGLTLMAVPLMMAILSRYSLLVLSVPHRQLIFTDVFILGLILFSFAATKNEGEHTTTTRLKALVTTSIIAIAYTLSTPLVYLLCWQTVHHLTAEELVITALVMYNIFFGLMKRSSVAMRNE